MLTQSIRAHRLASTDAVAQETASRLLTSARKAIAARGVFRVVLAGGRTPLAAYTILRGHSADWDHWHIFIGDERCLPPDDAERNSKAVTDAFLDPVGIPLENRHFIPAELGAEAGAAPYQALIADALPFDLVLLGMGEDGHTASLFPGHAHPDDALVVPVHHSPKPPADRISLTPKALAACAEMLILVTGASKHAALAAWRYGADLPVARVATLAHATVLLDDDAAADLAVGPEFTLPGLS